MSQDDLKRRDPFEDLNSGEPIEDLDLTPTSTPTPTILSQRPRKKQRETPIRPSERRRRSRQVTITFSNADIPDQLRDLARQWGMTGPDRRRPNVSGLLEYLLLPQLEAAEAGKIPPPNGVEK